MSGARIFKNASYLFLSNVIVRFLTALTTIFIARTLGATDYGILSVALAFAAVAGYFTDLGLTHTLMREATKEKANLPVLMSSFFKLRMAFALLTSLISILIFEIFYPDPYLRTIMYWVVIPTIFGAALQGVGAAYYQVIEKMQITAIIRTIAGLTTSLSLIAGMVFDWPLLYIGPIYGFSNVLAGIISLIIVMRSVSVFRGWDSSIMKGLVSFTLSGFAIMLLPQLGPIILEKVATISEVGFFSAAYRIPVVLYQIPGVVAAAFYPILFRHGNNKAETEHLQLNTIQIKVMSFLGVLMALPFLLYANWWVELLFGKEWTPAGPVLSILSIMIIIQSINYPIADALTTTGLQIKRTYVMMVGLICSVPLYIYLGSEYGATGGAIAAIVTECILVLGFAISYSKSKTLLVKGILRNMIAFLLTVALGLLLNAYIHPFIGNIMIVVVFISLTFLIDKDLRVTSISWIRKRLQKTRGNQTT